MLCINLLILPLLLVGATSAGDSDKKTDGYGTSGDMRCPGGNVFTVVYYNELSQLLEMKCAPALICGVPGARIGSSNRCAKDGEFMFKADEKNEKSGDVVETCNRYKLPPKKDYNQVCTEFYIKDQKEEEAGGLSGAKTIQNQGGRRHFNMSQSAREKIRERFPNFRGKRSQRLQKREIETAKTDIYKGELHGDPQMNMMVKEISRGAKRYKVVACEIVCTDSQEKDDEPEETVPETGDSGGGGMCFSPEVTVETMQGPVRMDQVKVGDKVLTYSAKLSIYAFDEIKYFLHREVDREANFIQLETKSGKTINLTPEHLIPTGPCGNEDMANPEQARRIHKDYTRAAKHAKTGDCLMVQTNGNHPFLDEITSVTVTTKRGIFAPVTSEGNMIVNGVHASCYSEFHSYEVLRGVFGVYQNLLDSVSSLVGTPVKANDDAVQSWSTVPLANALRLMIEAGKLF